MKLYFRCILCLLLMAMMAFAEDKPSVSSLEVPLTYQKNSPGRWGPSGYTHLQSQMKPPDGKWTFPKFNNEKPIYAQARLGDKTYLCVLDSENKGDAFYNRFYFDANGNGNLTDDPVTKGTIQDYRGGNYVSVDFSPVETTVAVDRQAKPYCFIPNVYFSGPDRKKINTEDGFFQFMLRPNCYYTGELSFNKQTYRLLLGDSNGNGRFYDRLSLNEVLDRLHPHQEIYPQGDQLYISKDQPGYYDGQLLSSDWLWIDGAVFEVALDVEKNRLKLTPVSGALCPVKVPSGMERMELYSEKDKRSIAVFRPTQEIRIPGGQYRLTAYQMVRLDKEGDKWNLDSRATFASPVMEVSEGKKAVCPFGEPFSALADIAPWEKARLKQDPAQTEVGLQFQIEGVGKEIVASLMRVSGNKTSMAMSVKNTQLPKEPSYTIVDSRGKEVDKGVFEYG